jgi:hypothetical protein
VLSSHLSASDRKILKEASSWVDRPANQDAAHAYQHGMARPGQTPAEALHETRLFVLSEIKQAVAWQIADVGYYEPNDHTEWFSYNALWHLGEAIHAAADQYSPSHGGQTWTGHESDTELAEHVWGESKPWGNDEELYEARVAIAWVWSEFISELQKASEALAENNAACAQDNGCGSTPSTAPPGPGQHEH